MIIDTSQGNVEIIGDAKEFKSSIDPKNLEFITTLLSSNLYSNPEESFIREIVSNAWDSHVEAGNTDTPVIIKFTNTCDNKSVTIRDYGTGLSPERFAEVYRNIGSSTKRESNDFIGCFGIGHLSPFACSNSVYITSYYNGVAYYYVGTKINNSITYHQLNELPTTEKNGVEITIKNIKNITQYESALQYITFFPNIYVVGAVNSTQINEVKLKRFNNFAAASFQISHKLLLGNVLYPIDKYKLSYEARNFIEEIFNTSIVIKFNVGELNITPNRESIIYSSKTIEVIEDRILAAKEELYNLISTVVSQDYTDISSYYKNMTSFLYYNPITNCIVNYSNNIRVSVQELPKCKITYKGQNLAEHLNLIRSLLHLDSLNFKGFLSNGTFYIKNMPWNCNLGNTVMSKNIVMLNKEARLSPTVKAYLKDNYDKCSIVTYFDEDDFINYVKQEFKSLKYTDIIVYIIKELYNNIIKNSEYLDLNTDTNFKLFKELYSCKKKDITENDFKEVILYRVTHGGYREKISFKNFKEAVKYIRNCHQGVIIGNMSLDDRIFGQIARIKRHLLFKAKKEVVDKFNNMNLSCIVDLDYIINKDSLLSKVKTVLKYFPSGINYLTLRCLMDNINNEERKEVKLINYLYTSYGVNTAYANLASRENIPYDHYIEYLCNKIKNYVDKQNIIMNMFNSNEYTSVLMTAAIIKTKIYKVSKKAYQNYKNNDLIKILCKK